MAPVAVLCAPRPWLTAASSVAADGRVVGRGEQDSLSSKKCVAGVSSTDGYKEICNGRVLSDPSTSFFSRSVQAMSEWKGSNAITKGVQIVGPGPMLAAVADSLFGSVFFLLLPNR